MIPLAIGIVVALIGAGLLVSGAPPWTRYGVFTLIPGSNHFTRYEIDVFSGGTVSVTFSVTSSGTVNVWVMTDAQHTAFLATGVLNYLAADSGSSGTFSATLPTGGTYFVETGHGSGYENLNETGLHTIVVNAWAAGAVDLALGAFVVAAVLVLIGLYLRTRPQKVRGYAVPPPYVPAQYPPYPGYPPYAGSPPGTPWAAAPGVPAAAPPGMGAILVTLENRSAADENVQILVNGTPAVSLTVPAGKTGQAHVRAPAAPPPGSPVHVEVVTGSGARASQDVVVAAEGSAQVSLRIG
ncbi:MAG TPA: hypothetical protein VEY12_08890 [Thermoplasmata archaeon]|nr:hypothetical protein [Thermoplasmata archaeon]